MSTTNFSHSVPGLVSLADQNCYVLSYIAPTNDLSGFNQEVAIFYAVSEGGTDNFIAANVDQSNVVGLGYPRMAYMPPSAGNPGRLFSAYNNGGTNGSIVINELQITKTSAGYTVSTLRNAVLATDTSDYDPAIAVVGNQLVVAYEIYASHILDMVISNDLVAEPETFTFNSVNGIRQPDGTPEVAAASPALVAANGSLYLAWKVYDVNSGTGLETILVAGYAPGQQSPGPLARTQLGQNMTDTAPALTYANGELYLVYCYPVTQHICLWRQTDWNRVQAVYTGDSTHSQPSVCSSLDSSTVVAAWLGDDENATINVANEGN